MTTSASGSWVNHTTKREVYIPEKLLAWEEEQRTLLCLSGLLLKQAQLSHDFNGAEWAIKTRVIVGMEWSKKEI